MAIGLIVYDIVMLLLAVGLYGGSAWVTWQLIQFLDPWLSTGLLIALWPAWAVVFLLVLIGALGVLCLISPPMPEGKFAAPGSTGFWIWTWRFALRRLVSIQPISTVIHWSALLRWLCYRALGMKLAFESSMSSDVIIVDPPLLSVGRKGVIGGRTLIGCHYTNKYPDGHKLITKRSRIGDNVNIGMDCVIGPGCEIEDDVTIGTNSVLTVSVKVGKGANIKAFSTIPPKTVIPAGTVYPPVPEEAGSVEAGAA